MADDAFCVNIETICDAFSVVYGLSRVLADQCIEEHVYIPFHALF